MCEQDCRSSHNEAHDDPNLSPKQLANRAGAMGYDRRACLLREAADEFPAGREEERSEDDFEGIAGQEG